MWRNDTKCKYMFMFPLKNLARKGLRISCECHKTSLIMLIWWVVTFGSGNGLVPSSNKTLPEPISTRKFSNDMALLGHSELNLVSTGSGNAVSETNVCPLANGSKFWVGLVKTWHGWVEFGTEHMRDNFFEANAPVMAWCHQWSKPIPEQVLAKFYNC